MMNLDAWKIKREHTYRSFCLVALCLGAEYSIIIPSLWFYLDKVIQTNHVKIYYGFTLSIYYLVSILTTFIVSRYVDKSRRIRCTMLTLLSLEVFGSILYTIDTSVYFPLIARAIQGVGDFNMSMITAELARSYPVEDCTSKIATLVACYSASFVIAPGLNVVFKYVNFTLFGFNINYGNVPGFVMAIIFIILFGVVFVYVSDLSKEYDLKEECQKMNTKTDSTLQLDTDEESTENNTLIAESSNNKTFHPRLLLCSFDFMFLIFLGFFMSYCVVAFLDVTMPIIASKYYKLDSQDIGILFFSTGALFMVCLHFVKKALKRVTEHTLLIIGLFIFLISTLSLLCVSIIKSTNYILGLSLLVVNVLLIGLCWCVEQVFIRSMLVKITPSGCQTFGEGLRRSSSASACIISSFVTPLMLEWLFELSFIVILLTFVFIGVLFIRRTTLRRLQILDTLSTCSEQYNK